MASDTLLQENIEVVPKEISEEPVITSLKSDDLFSETKITKEVADELELDALKEFTTDLYIKKSRKLVDELFALIALTEELTQNIRYIERNRILFAIFMVISGFIAMITQLNFSLSNRSNVFVFIGLAFFIGCIIIYNGRFNKQLNREKRALNETVSIIQELEVNFSEILTPLERAQVRIRLSRLDIASYIDEKRLSFSLK